MSARSELAGKKKLPAHLGPSQAIFCVGREINKNVDFLLIFQSRKPHSIKILGRSIGLALKLLAQHALRMRCRTRDPCAIREQ